MNYRQILPNNFLAHSSHLEPQPLPAWTAILGLVFVTALCILAGAGSLLRLAFPVGAFAVGLFLYLRYPILYVGFTWWMWFLTPWLRRVIDFRSGWDQQGVILVAPFLVTLITLVTFFHHLPKAYRHGGLPFILAISSVFYGFLIGLIHYPPLAVARAFLDWLTPVLFGFHLFVNWRDYHKLRQNIQSTFLWGVLVTGFYGVYQYLVAPAWDCFWIIQTDLSTNGTPEPLGIRVFSTMNSPAPFANVMMAGLLLLFTSKAALRLPVAVAGYLSFLLSLLRSAWGSWFIAVLTLTASLKARLQMRLIIIIMVMAVCVLPLATIQPFSEIINSRLATISNIKEDQSFGDRSDSYGKKINLALSNVLGNGIGSVYHVNEKGILEMVALDSGILDSFFTLGWFGAIPYLGGLFLLLFSLFQGVESRFDPYVATARAISLGMLLQLTLGSVMLSLSGLVLWGFIGIGMAGNKYYRHQRITRL